MLVVVGDRDLASCGFVVFLFFFNYNFTFLYIYVYIWFWFFRCWSRERGGVDRPVGPGAGRSRLRRNGRAGGRMVAFEVAAGNESRLIGTG